MNTLEAWYRHYTNTLQKHYPFREAKNITQWVFECCLGLSRAEILEHKTSRLEKGQKSQLKAYLDRLSQGEPVQYVLGEIEFYGIKLKIDRRALIPRPETELLVDWIVETHQNRTNDHLRILDIGTGSGCIAIALKQAFSKAKVTATDRSSNALRLAKENADRQQLDIQFLKENVLDFKSSEQHAKYDIMVSNPPYVKQSEREKLAVNVIDYEPEEALLVSDEDALLFFKAVSDFAGKHLKAGGYLYFEIHEAMGQEVRKLLVDKGFKKIRLNEDLSGKERMICARKG